MTSLESHRGDNHVQILLELLVDLIIFPGQHQLQANPKITLPETTCTQQTREGTMCRVIVRIVYNKKSKSIYVGLYLQSLSSCDKIRAENGIKVARIVYEWRGVLLCAQPFRIQNMSITNYSFHTSFSYLPEGSTYSRWGSQCSVARSGPGSSQHTRSSPHLLHWHLCLQEVRAWSCNWMRVKCKEQQKNKGKKQRSVNHSTTSYSKDSLKDLRRVNQPPYHHRIQSHI